YLPIFLLERVEGRIFAPMAHTVVSALLGSLIFSVTLIPVLAALAYRKPHRHRRSPILLWCEKIYTKALDTALAIPRGVMIAAVLFLIVATYILATQGSEFLPELNEGGLYITFTLPANISLTEGRKMVPMFSQMIDQFPEVESYSSQLGR